MADIYSLLKDESSDTVSHLGTGADVYVYTVPANRTAELYRLLVVIVDGSMDPTDFGGIAGELTNGCLIYTKKADGTVKQTFTDGWTVKKNVDWSLLAGPDAPVTAVAGDDTFVVRWTFNKAGSPITLSQGEKFCVETQDSLDAITQFRIMIQGRYTEGTS